ncbi:MAG: hypothetical protein JXR94_15130 [Candidatus Hydrogenedentes bacterium]|nr:hypothetical protein [Candidatus Hydrogenedentota bacterium]
MGAIAIAMFAVTGGVAAFGQAPAAGGDAAVYQRTIHAPKARHVGNVYYAGEDVIVPVPDACQGRAVRWAALDDALTLVGEGALDGGATSAGLGGLGVGWYRIEFMDARDAVAGFATAAVLAPPTRPVPDDSPVCVDGALSWYRTDDFAVRHDLAHLGALAGINWIRDRIHWREVQTAPDTFVADTKYDAVADMEAGEGLKVLQVFHTTPTWAVDGEYTNLLHLYAFCKAMAARFRGRVQAWEPWNEGNAGNFGGRTIDDLCAHQKAAYLGFKAGDPGLTVCWNPLGGINTAALARGILENETWPYYDVYSIHSYDWPHDYERLWAPARDAASGRPIWVTECDRGMKADPDSPCGDYTHADAVRKAEFMAHSYATSLFAGSSRHFHFILGYYMEGEHTVQFGLLRQDLTPRPSYVALAALGRLLAGAECLGRWPLADQPDAHVYAFRATPDGIGPPAGDVARDVLVAWTEQRVDWEGRGAAHAEWALPDGVAVESVFDYLGRPLGAEVPSELRSAAVFVVLPPGEAGKLPLQAVPAAAYRQGEPSRVVLQLEMPRSSVALRREGWTQAHEYTLAPGSETAFSLCAYNLGDEPVKGTISVTNLPAGWEIAPDHWDIAIEPMTRQRLSARMGIPASGVYDEACWIRAAGDFGSAGHATLAFRVVPPDPPEPGK